MEIDMIATSRDEDAALLELLNRLKFGDYTFITPTPATHARVVARPDRRLAQTIEDVLGWSMPFGPDLMPAYLLTCLKRANVVEGDAERMRCRIRVSSLGSNLYLHSAYPTLTQDAVFFGPDSYRFAELVRHELESDPPAEQSHLVDIGTGAGVGAIVAATASPRARLTMTDINLLALRYARLNALAAGARIDAIASPGIDRVQGPIDVAMINPPYIIDEDARTYRDGGGMHGAELSLKLSMAALDRLNSGGRVILYTGSAIVAGQDALHTALKHHAAAKGCSLEYREIDPDIFGEELDRQAYRDVDRIALVTAIIRRPA